MKSFKAILAISAMASLANAFDCSTLTDPTATDSCAAYPEFAQMLDGTGVTWTAIPVQTSDGYNLNLIRITGTTKTAAAPSTLGPLLLHHGRFGDSSEWFEKPDDSLPARLREVGYDVYLTNKRGTKPSRTHQTLDPNTADYWNFTYDEIANNDLTASVSGVLKTRGTDGLSCEKVQILTNHIGAQEALIMLANNATKAQSYVERVVTIGSCHVYNKALVLAVIGDNSAFDDRRMLRDLKHAGEMLTHPHWDPWAPSNWCSRNEYYAELRRIKSVLGYWKYMDFYRALKSIKRSKYGRWGPDNSFYCDGKWKDTVKEALCLIDRNQPECVPETYSTFSSLINYLRTTCNANSLFGPNWATELACLCASADFTSTCTYFTNLKVFDDAAPQQSKLAELGIKQAEHIMQQAIAGTNTQFNTNWATSGWVTQPASYDLSPVATPLRSQWIDGDVQCNVETNTKLQAAVTTETGVKIYKDQRIFKPFFTAANAAIDETGYLSIFADLTALPSAAVCTDGNYPW